MPATTHQTVLRGRAIVAALFATPERQASQDRIAQFRQEILAGVETFFDPFTQAQVQLPVGWNDYYVNDRGQYLVTQAGIDPSTIVGPGWQRLQPDR